MNEAATQAPTSARIRVFWQPGCSSCLRTKEFLTRQGIEFESIDVHNDPEGRAALAALGARSVPVVALGSKYTFCQSINDVIRFLDLKTKPTPPLPPEALVRRLAFVLEANARYTRQFSADFFREPFRNRNRTPAGLSFHVFRVAEMGVQAAHQIELRFEGFDEAPPPEWQAEDIARWGESVRAKLLDWWEHESDRSLSYDVPTYYGRRSMHEVLERTAWHSAQHTRQVMLMLESDGATVDRPLTAGDLEGLPLPDEVWDR
ncbi:glutaredoxin domain-containing protein [Caballeronia concitans]|uniref:Glutaredoxin-like protein n=1 Tax=Caballeronia concitans TaxID=1777133 RepID=A0A658QTV3_9BURK|nr:glutaredoxin domain-containing protein [Caballeronia concitans]KIG10075.1 glutaredoxin [Burkholderia sp. MR1]SAL21298.1 glutaredoxin-like protein [Caballeronia concitans]